MTNTVSLFPFSSAYDLSYINFIGGADQNLLFYVYTSSSALVNLNACTIVWKLAPYGQSIAIVTKSGSYITNSGSCGFFNVYLPGSDSQLLSGKFVQSYSITDISGSTFIPSMGLVDIQAGLI